MKKLCFLLLCLCSVCLSSVLVAQPSKVAFISTYANLNDLQTYGDDDEAAAANWLVNNYGGSFLSVSQIKDNSVDLSSYKALWIHFDRQSDETIINNEFTSAFLDDDVRTAINYFYKAGGNLLLSVYATRYLIDLGRYDLAIEIKSYGNGADNPDIWYASPTWGTFIGAPEVFNRISDPIYNDMEVHYVNRDNGNVYPIIPLLGPGWKEDHNNFWNPQPDKANNDKYKLLDFENIWSSTSLATWAHVQDYFGSAITRWNAKGDYTGKAITIGIGCYEWSQNSGTNLYQFNIEQLTKNALDELSPSGMSTYFHFLQGVNEKLKPIINNNTILFQNISNVVSCRIYSIDGKLINRFQLNRDNSSFDVTYLKNGIYLFEANDQQNSISFKFIKSYN